MLFALTSLAQDFEQLQKITPDHRKANEAFGHSLDVKGDYAIVGKPFERRDAGPPIFSYSAGSAYIYKRNEDGEWEEHQKLIPESVGYSVVFGFAVRLWDDYAFVSSRDDQTNSSGEDQGRSLGSVYVYKRDCDDVYQKIQKLGITPDSTLVSGSFGMDVVVDDGYAFISDSDLIDTMFMGGYHHTGGEVYAFELEGDSIWRYRQTLVPDQRHRDQEFGLSLAYENGVLAIGAPGDDGAILPEYGAVYLFEKNQNGLWEQSEKLVEDDQYSGKRFGFSVDMQNGQLAIGAPLDSRDENGEGWVPFSGAVYVFEKNADQHWTQQEKLIPQDRKTGYMRFGWTVCLQDNYLAVGADSDYDEDKQNFTSSDREGSVYIFERNDSIWLEKGNLFSWESTVEDHFGRAVAFNQDELWVGATGEKTDQFGIMIGPYAGAVYVYKTDDIQFEEEIPTSFSLYPNPTANYLNIEMNACDILDIEIYNSLGQKVLEIKEPQYEVIDVSHLSVGTYQMRIRSIRGTETQSFSRR